MTTALKEKAEEEVATDTTFAFSPRQFAAIQRLTTFCTVPKDSRPILESVNFNRHDGMLRLEATDSYSLTTMEFPELTNDFIPFQVPAVLLNRVKLSAKAIKQDGYTPGSGPAIIVTYWGESKSATVSYDGATFTESVESFGQYPSLQHVLDRIPEEPVEMGVIGLNPVFLAKIGKFFQNETLRFKFAGETAVTITNHAVFSGLKINATAYLMPVRIQ